MAEADDGLYKKEYKKVVAQIKFIPYYAFANRGECDMLVWVNAFERF